MSRRGKLVAGSAALVVAGAAATAAVGFGTGNEPATGTAQPAAASTAKVQRDTLTETTDLDGTLGYGDTTPVAGGSGVVTWLPRSGAVIRRGQQVYRANDAPVLLLIGSLPLYRVLKKGDRGADVRMLETNLAALGYDGFTVNDEYTGATATAVKQWQDDLGITKTGRIDPAMFVVATAPIRIAAVSATLGARAQGAVLTYSGTTRRVDVDLDAADETSVRKGMPAKVVLPDGGTVAATVTDVGTVATSSGGDSPGDQQTTTIPVTFAVKDQRKLGTLDEAPVTVTVVSDERRNVLTVPVTALVALLDGGYGVEVVAADGTKHYATVTTGMFADGKVEVSGPEIKAGVTVTVPA